MILRTIRCFSTDPSTTEIYTLSLHDALPICRRQRIEGKLDDFLIQQSQVRVGAFEQEPHRGRRERADPDLRLRSEEHTSELQSPDHLVCRLLLEKKKYQLERRVGLRHSREQA